MEQQYELKFRLVKCEELSYKTNIDSSLDINSDNLSFNYGFKLIHVGENRVSFHIAVLYRVGYDDILKQESAITYDFEHLDDAISFTSDDRFVDKVGIVPTLFSIAYSTVRGMLAIRTAGSRLENFPAPIINPSAVIKSLESK